MESRLKSVKESLAAAALRCGRDPATLTLVAVSKTRSVEEIRALALAGHRDFGENYVQELVTKHAALRDEFPDLRWHFVGRLQTNKVKLVAPFVSLIHTVDSVRLLEELERRAAEAGRVVDALVQLNISDEKQKNGTDERGLAEIVAAAERATHVRLRGLMGMAEHTDDENVLRKQFKRLRLAKPEFWDILSMGMSDDYPLAIEEGATHVRIGTALFGPRGTNP
jgi:pyridoxal phosphate enzyme (YggS family)